MAAPDVSTSEDVRQADTSMFDETLLSSIVSIEENRENRPSRPLGTGFLVKTGRGPVLLCTAKHVVLNPSGTIKLDLTYRLVDHADRTSVLHDRELRQAFGAWYVAENDDLSCRFIASTPEPSLVAISTDQFMRADRLRAATPVIALGFPLGLRSLHSPKAIVRGGIVARVDRDGILLDVLIFHGSSGSPVMYSGHISDTAPEHTAVPQRHMLLGVVTGFVPYRDRALTQQAGNAHILSIIGNTGLATAVPADRLLTLIDRADVQERERLLVTIEKN